ncbi:MAG TPA: right-handed parallel beta-helix repeat-containing protein [Terriglobales bacterium]|nr:right-handed parallel beta-helix repeat-containing protein [Terriglobales bacterium]
MTRNPNAVLYGISTAILSSIFALNIGANGSGSAANHAPAGGRNYYVSPDGSDRNEGSLKHPWMTIERAASWLLPGDTVHVLPGEYRGRIATAVSGLANARITYISDQKWGAHIIGDVIDRSAWDNRGNYVDITGFDVSGIGRTGIYNDGSHVRFIANHVHDIAGPTSALCDNGGAGIFHGNYSGFDNDTIGNRVHDVGWTNASLCATSGSQVHGIYHANRGGHILNNIVYHNRAYGIHLWHAASDVVISGNTVFNNGSSGLVVGAGDKPKGNRADNCLVSNNIFAYNARYGFVESGNTGIHNRYIRNLTHENKLGSSQLQNGNVATGTVNADPQFVNYTGDSRGDHRLRPGSPALRSGSTEGAPRDDIEGRARSIASGIDIGAYQSSSISRDSSAVR